MSVEKSDSESSHGRIQKAAHLAIGSTPEYFYILVMMFLIGKKPAAKKFYDGKVSNECLK